MKVLQTFLKYAYCTSSIAAWASTSVTNLDNLALACAVDNRINVSKVRTVTGWV